MAHITEDRVLETATAVATTAFTLAGAVTGFRTFASQLVTNDTCFYAAQEVDANGTPTGNWENGLGTLTAATTLTRTTVLESSNAGAAVTFGAGTIQVAIGLLASRNLHYDNNLTVHLESASAEPPTPASGKVFLYARTILPNHTVLKVKRPSGVDSPLQDGLAFNRYAGARGSSNVASASGFSGLTTVGAISASVPNTASATIAQTLQSINLNSTATAGTLGGLYANNREVLSVFRGNVAGHGGFRYCQRFSLNTLQAGNRGFFGLVDVFAAPTNVDPTTNTTPGKIGLAFNANTGNFRIVHNITGTAPTVTDLGANFPINNTDLYELVLFCPPHNGTTAGNVSYRIRWYSTSGIDPIAEVTGIISTNLPANTTLLMPSSWMTNNATAAAVSWRFVQLSVESDF